MLKYIRNFFSLEEHLPFFNRKSETPYTEIIFFFFFYLLQRKMKFDEAERKFNITIAPKEFINQKNCFNFV